MHADIVRRAFEVFRIDAEATPEMTLRGGSAADDYAEVPGFDPRLDEATDAYLEAYAFSGLVYLDAASWRHYLPRLIDYALRHLDSHAPGTMAIDGLLWSLRPPDREPPRLGSLSAEQEAVIVAFLDVLTFDGRSVHQDFAMQVLEEYWLPNALYRQRSPEEP
jgi:uncharacterized protein DUF6714